MKRLVCEMCGGTDIVKQDGMFVCQSCGVKYSPEEARKIMVEGTVRVTGSVQVDQSERTAKLRKAAEAAVESQDFDSAQRQYGEIASIDPLDWEASVLHTITKTIHQIRRNKEANLPQLCMDAGRSVEAAVSAIDKEAEPKAVLESAKRINSALYWLRCSAENNVLTRFAMAGGAPTPFFLNSANDDAVEVKYKIARRLKDWAKNSPEVLRFAAEMLGECEGEYRSASRVRSAQSAREMAEKSISRAYWAAHPEEKQSLTEEQTRLEEKKKDLERQIAELEASLPEKAAMDAAVQARDSAIQARDAITGLFKGKQKKEAQAKADQAAADAEEAEKQYRAALASAAAPLDKEKTACEHRLQKISDKLARP